MSNNRTAKKQKKQLVNDYHMIVSPLSKPRPILITKELTRIEQSFEVFTLYKTNGGTVTSNKTIYLTERSKETINA